MPERSVTYRLIGDFDAVVGRYVLMFAADPVSVVRAAVDHLKPGGLVAFQTRLHARALLGAAVFAFGASVEVDY